MEVDHLISLESFVGETEDFKLHVCINFQTVKQFSNRQVEVKFGVLMTAQYGYLVVY